MIIVLRVSVSDLFPPVPLSSQIHNRRPFYRTSRTLRLHEITAAPFTSPQFITVLSKLTASDNRQLVMVLAQLLHDRKFNCHLLQ